MRFQNPFSRVTSGGKVIPEIDGLRFVAITSVVCYHLFGQLKRYYTLNIPHPLEYVLANGDRGVRLFFVISGFILALPFARSHMLGAPPVSLRRYVVRRITRIEPPFVLAMVGLACFVCFALHNPAGQTLEHLIAILTYSHSLVFGQMSEIAPVTWSLEVEVQFYILAPWLTSIFAVRTSSVRRGILLGSVFAAGVLQSVLRLDAGRLHLSLLYYIQFFLVGFLLADLFLSKTHLIASWKWDVASVIGLLIVFVAPTWSIQLAMPLLTFSFYWAVLNGKMLTAFFRHPVTTSIGAMCYTIYLLHLPLIALATRIVGHSRPFAMIVTALVMIALVCSAFFLLIEKPCMNLNLPIHRSSGPQTPVNQVDQEVPLLS